MKEFLKKIHAKAKKEPHHIVFTEWKDARIVEAIRKVAKLKIAKPVLILKGHKKISGVETVDMTDRHILENYAEHMHRIRKKKGWTYKKCLDLVKQPNYFGTMMVATGDVDGLLAGATQTTAQTLRPFLQLVGTKKAFHHVSGLFFMILQKKKYVFADCAVNIQPDAKTLAEIAIDSASTAKEFGINPRIAMLSFSTHGSAQHESLDKIRKAVRLVKRKRRNLLIDGELQVDAALVPEVARCKSKRNILKGKANVLIFPDLNSGNIAYKLVERLGGAQAIGPVIQGMKKPVNDLSRGCNVTDIIHMTAITNIQVKK